MSRYTHHGETICKISTNHPKGQKLDILTWVGESNRILRRNGVELSVYYFFHGDFVDVKLLAPRCYFHVKEEGPDECIFDHTEEPSCKKVIIQPDHGTEAEN